MSIVRRKFGEYSVLVDDITSIDFNASCPNIFISKELVHSRWNIMAGWIVNCMTDFSVILHSTDMIIVKEVEEMEDYVTADDITVEATIHKAVHEFSTHAANECGNVYIPKFIFSSKMLLREQQADGSFIDQRRYYLGMEYINDAIAFRQNEWRDDAEFAETMISISGCLSALQNEFHFMHRDLHLYNIVKRVEYRGVVWYMLDFDFSRIVLNLSIGRPIVVDHKTDINWRETFNPTHDIRSMLFSMTRRNQNGEIYCVENVPVKYVCPYILQLVNRYEVPDNASVSEWYDNTTWDMFWHDFKGSPTPEVKHIWSSNLDALKHYDSFLHPHNISRAFSVIRSQSLADRANLNLYYLFTALFCIVHTFSLYIFTSKCRRGKMKYHE